MPVSESVLGDIRLIEEDERRRLAERSPPPLTPKFRLPPLAQPFEVDQREADRLRATMQYGSRVDPEKEARVQRLRMQTGLPADLLRLNLDEVEQMQRVHGANVGEMIRRAPAVSKWMQHPDNAGLIVDDAANATRAEWMLKSGIHALAQKGLGQVELGFRAQPLAVFGGETLEAIGKAAGQSLGGRIAGSIVKGLVGTAEENEQRMRYIEKELLPRYYGEETFLQRGWVSMWEQAPQIAGAVVSALAGAGAALVAGQLGPQAGLPEELITVPKGAMAGAYAWSFIQESGGQYRALSQLKDANGVPLNPTAVYVAGTIGGAISAGLEVAGLRYMAGAALPDAVIAKVTGNALQRAFKRRAFTTALRSFAVAGAKAAVAEPTTEMLQEITAIIAEEAVAELQSGPGGTGRSWEEHAARIAEVGLRTFEMMVVGGMLAAGPRIGIDGLALRRAERDAGRMQALAENATASKLRERIPEKYREMLAGVIEGGGTPKEVYVAVERWNQTWQGMGVDPAQAALEVTGDATAHAEAMRTGGDLIIPMDRFMEKVAPSNAFTSLQPHMRLYQGRLSLAEAETANNERIEAVIAAVNTKDEEFDADQRVVYEETRAKFLQQERLGHDEGLADVGARFHTQILGNIAKKAGMSLLDAHRAFPFAVGNAQRRGRGRERLAQSRIVPTQAERDMLDEQVQALTQQQRDAIPGVKQLEAFIAAGGDLHIANISVEQAQRGRGQGTRALQALLDWADERDMVVSLDPRPDKGKRAALHRLYRRLGFAPNGKGRSRFYEPAAAGEWVRPPISSRSDRRLYQDDGDSRWTPMGREGFEFLDPVGGIPATARVAIGPLSAVPGEAQRWGVYLPQGDLVSSYETQEEARTAAEQIARNGNWNRWSYVAGEAVAEFEPVDWAEHEPPTTKAGKFMGGPEWMTDRPALRRLRSRLYMAWREGRSRRHWYKTSAEMVLHIAQGDVLAADRLLMLLALYSPNNAVLQNTIAAIKAFTHWRDGRPREELHGGTEHQNTEAAKILYDNGQMAEGRKVQSFWTNLRDFILQSGPHAQKESRARPSNPSGVVTVDLWMYRLFGYLRAVGQNDVAGTGRYSFIENEVRRLTARINQSLEPGEAPWLPHEVQAAMWASTKARYEIPSVQEKTIAESVSKGHSRYDEAGTWLKPEKPADRKAHDQIWRKHAMRVRSDEVARYTVVAGRDYADVLGEMSHNVTWETVPDGVVLPTDLRRAFHDSAAALILDDEGKDLLAKRITLGLLMRAAGSGTFENEINPNTISSVVPARIAGEPGFDLGKLNLYARALQYIFHQKAVPWMRIAPAGKKAPGPSVLPDGTKTEVVNGAVLVFRDEISSAQLEAVYEKLREINPNLGYTRFGRRLVVANFKFMGIKPAAFRGALEKLEAEHGEALGIDREASGHVWIDGYYGPEAGPAVQEAIAGLGSDLQSWLLDRREAFEKLVDAYVVDPEARRSELEQARGLTPTPTVGDTEHRFGEAVPKRGYDPRQQRLRFEQALTDLESAPPPVSLAGRDTSGTREIANRIRKEFQAKGFIDVRGMRASTPAEIAAIARIWRDPRYETGRIVWVKGGVVVAIEAVTARDPGAATYVGGKAFASRSGTRMFHELNTRKERLAADGYWLVHNHPSGNPSPSEQDRLVTASYNSKVSGMLGSIVIDHDDFTLLTAQSVPGGTSIEESRSPLTPGPDPLLHDLSEFGSVFKEPASDAIRVARIARKLMQSGTVDPSAVMLIYSDVRGWFRMAEQVPYGLLWRGREFSDWVRGRRKATGSYFVTAYMSGTPSGPTDRAVHQHLVNGNLTEALFDTGVSGGRQKTIVATAKYQIPHAYPSDKFNPQRLYQDDDGKNGYLEFHGGRRFSIGLFKTANRSTPLHELGHLYLEIMGDLASEPEATQEIKDLYAGALKSLGVTERSQITGEHRESWARMFETYLYEGKSPTPVLARVFAQMRRWMVRIYHSIERMVGISDEVRDVFDRLVASDEEIATARTKLAIDPLTGLQPVMSQAEWARYSALAERAKQEGEDDLRRRLMGDLARETTEWYREARDKIRQEVGERLAKLPAMRVLRYFERGQIEGYPDLPPEFVGARGRRKMLDRASVEALAQPLQTDRLQRYTRAEGGVSVQELAGILGVDPQALLDSLDTHEVSYRETLDRTVQSELESKYGAILEDGPGLAQEALEAAQTPAVVEQILVELRTLRRLLAGQEKSPPLSTVALERQALAQLRARRIKDLAPRRYLTTAIKHGTEAARAMGAKNAAKAADAKALQLWNVILFRTATELQRQVDVEVRKLKRFTKAPARAKLGKAGPEYLSRVDELLNRYSFRYESAPAIARRESLRAWVARKQAEHEDVVVPESVLERATTVNYREITVEELLDLGNAVTSIAHQAKLKNTLLTAKGERDYESMIGLLLATAAKLPDRGLPPIEDDTTAQGGFFQRWDAQLLRIQGVIEILDGGPRGPWHDAIWNLVSHAQSAEGDLLKSVGFKVAEIFMALPKSERNLMKQTVEISVPPSTRAPNGKWRTSRATLVALALNAGNEGQVQRVLDGYGWDEDILRRNLNLLRQSEAVLVQRVWDTLEDEFWSKIEALERRQIGLPPEKVARQPLTINTVDGHEVHLKGGYFPLRYADRRAGHLQEQSSAASVAGLFMPGYARATTPHSWVERRAEHVEAPLRLSLETLTRHIQLVIHDLTHREAVLSIHKVLRDPRISEQLSRRIGRDERNELDRWLVRIANDRVGIGNDAGERVFRFLRTNMTTAIMGFAFRLGFQNFVNFFNALERARVGTYTKAMGETWAHWGETVAYIHGLSGEMRHRYDNYDREQRDNLRRLAGRTDWRATTIRFMFSFQNFTDKLFAYPLWLASYRESGDVDVADGTVTSTLGAAGAKDLAPIQTGTEASKLATFMYGWFSCQYLRNRMLGHDVMVARRQGTLSKDWPTFLGRAIALAVIPTLASQLMLGRGPEDDEGWLEWAAWELALYPFMLLPVIGGIASSSMGVMRERYASPRLGPIGALDKVVIEASHVLDRWMDKGKVEPKAVGKAVNRLAGVVSPWPSNQAEVTLGYLYDVFTGEERPEDVIEFAYKLTYRRKPERERRRRAG